MLKGRDIISALDFEREDVLDLIKLAEKLRRTSYVEAAKGRIMITAFFEPSTRTRLSFTFAMKRLGGIVIDMGPEQVTSRAKGESFEDTVRMLDGYKPDLIVIRHPEVGSASRAASIAEAPVINAGDGWNEHPTQALTDLYTLWREYGRLDELKIVVMGDLKYGRTPSSLSFALSLFKNVKIIYVSPPQLRIREDVLDKIRGKIEFKEVSSLEEIKEPVHAVYVTRVQKERFKNPEEYEKLKDSYVLSLRALEKLPGNPIVMHPLPRITELPQELDTHPRSRYFQQARNGMYIRMALVCAVLGLECG